MQKCYVSWRRRNNVWKTETQTKEKIKARKYWFEGYFNQTAAGVDDGGHVMADKMAKYIYHSKADTTNRKHYYSFKQLETYCKSKGFYDKPANSMHVAMFITELFDKKVSFSVITAAYYSIKWAHKMNDFQDPTETIFAKNLFDAGKHLRYVPVKKKDIANTEM